MTTYPVNLDTDASLPSALDGATENTAEVLNNLKAAIIAIEKAIGTNPQGVLGDTVARLAVSLNTNGTLKASALIAAGMVALPITNAQISSSAAIEESKLDLDFATSVLNSQISSHEIDINALQIAILNLISDLAQHVSGDADNHDGYAIFLDNLSPLVTPDWLEGIDAHDVSTAIMLLAKNAAAHTASNAVSAHSASNISVDAFANFASADLQTTLNSIVSADSVEVSAHSDFMHANGISRWENSSESWNQSKKKYPSSGLATATSTSTNILNFTGANMTTLKVVRGDVVVISNVAYKISDVGPRAGIGGKPLLTAEQVEIMDAVVAGATFSAEIFSKSSVLNLKSPLVSTTFPGNSSVDTIVVALPNAAKIVSLGLKPYLISNTDTLEIEVGSPNGSVRLFTVSNLNKDRLGFGTVEVTLFSIADRINYVLNSSAVSNRAFVSAYVIGDEIALIHHLDLANCSLKIKASTANSLAGAKALGFGVNGTNAVDVLFSAGEGSKFSVNGKLHSTIPAIWSGGATISGSTFAVASVDLISAGVKKGHLVCLTSGPTNTQLGTYQISAITSNSISVAESLDAGTASITVLGNSVSLSDLDGSSKASLNEIFVRDDAKLDKSLRLSYIDAISGLKIVDASDGLIAGTYTLSSVADGSNVALRFGTSGAQKPTIVPNTFVGLTKVVSPSGIDFVEVSLNGSVGIGTSIVTVFDHIDEEDLFEISQIRLAGRVCQSIVDKRMFGFVGIDEIREDVISAFVESSVADLRTDGIVSGFEILQDNVDAASLGYPAGTKAFLINGGTAYVSGARVSQISQYVVVPAMAGIYVAYVDANSTISVANNSQYSANNMFAGKIAGKLPLVIVTNSGSAITTQSCAFSIANIDLRQELVLDLTDEYTGNFNSVTAAVTYLNSFPSRELRQLRITSRDGSAVDLSALTAECEIVIDGYVGELTIASNCKITSTSPNKTNANISSLVVSAATVDCSNISIANVSIDATILSGGAYSFKNCAFAQNAIFSVVDPSDVVEVVALENCESISAGFLFNVIAGNCDFHCFNSSLISNGTSSILSVRNAYLENSIFNNFKISSTTASSDYVFRVNDCEFLSSVGAILNIPSVKTILSNSDFKYISLNALNPTCCLLGDASVSNVSFSNISVSYGDELSNGMLISASENSVIVDIALSNSTITNYLTPTVKAGFISGLTNRTAGELSVGVKYLTNSNNVTFVKKSYSSLSISNCSLVQVGSPNLVLFEDNVKISNVKFSIATGTGIRSEVTAVSGFNVDSCTFESSSTGTSFELDSVLTFDGGFSNCKFLAPIASNSAAISGIKFSNNDFANSFVLGIGSAVVFDGCDFSSLTIAGTYSDVSVLNCSVSGALNVSGSGTNTTLSNVVGNISISGSQSRIVISGCRGALTTLSSANLTGLISLNVFDASTDLSMFEFLDCRIVNNIFRSALVRLTSGGSVFVEQNTFSNNVEINDLFSNSSFKSNNSIASGSSVFVFATIANTNFTDNTNLNYSFAGQATGMIFSGNVGASTATFAGRLLNCQFNDNRITTMNFSTNSIDSVMIKGHVGTSFSISDSKGSLKNLLLSNSFISNVAIYDGALTSEIEKLFITGLNGTTLKLFPNLSSMASISCLDFSVDSSTVTAIDMFKGTDMSGAHSVKNISLTRNVCTDVIFSGAKIIGTELLVDGLVLLGNRITNLLLGIDGLGGNARLLKIRNTNITGNILSILQNYVVDSDTIVIDSNFITGIVEFYVVASLGTASLKNFKFTKNNAIGTSLVFQSKDLSGTTDFSSYYSGLNIDLNSFDALTFASGTRENTKDITSLSVCDNMFGPMQPDPSAISTSAYGVFFESANNDVTSITSLKSVSICRNRCFIHSESVSVYPFVVNFNCFDKETSLSKFNVSDNHGLLLKAVFTAGTFNMYSSRIRGNEILGLNFDFVYGDMNDILVTDNVIRGDFNILNVDSMLSLVMTSNTGPTTIALSGVDVISHVFGKNSVDNYTLTAIPSLAAAPGTIQRAVISDNDIAGSIFLDKFSSFSAADGQSKIINNFAGAWVGNSSSPIFLTSANRIFAWGNTGSTSSSVTLNGTTATNIVSANNLSGTGIQA